MRQSRSSVQTTTKSQKPENVKAVKHFIAVGRREIVGIDTVTVWKDNPYTGKNVSKIMAGIKKYGQRTAIVGWEKNRTIYKGNRTYLAMKKLGFKEIAIDWHDFENDAEAEQYALSDNNVADKVGIDEEIYYRLMKSETMSGARAEDIGLSDKEFATMMMQGVKVEKLPDVDVIGVQSNVGSVMLIQFDTEAEMEFFKLEVMGIKSKQQKVIQYTALKDKLDPVFSGTLYKDKPETNEAAPSSQRRARR